jgi:hypothetical protein
MSAVYGRDVATQRESIREVIQMDGWGKENILVPPGTTMRR